MPAERAPKGARLAGRYLAAVRRRLRRAVPDLHDRDRRLQARRSSCSTTRSCPARSRSTCSARRGPTGTSVATSSTRSIVASIITIGQLVTSVLSGYAFSMLDFPGRNVLFVLFISTMLVPLEATLVVNRRTIGTLGWINTYQGLAIPFVATAFGTFLVRQAFLGLPARAARRGAHRRRRTPRVPVARRRAGRAPDARRARAVQLPVGVEPVPLAEPDHDRGRHEHRAERAQGACATSAIQQPGVVMAGTIIAAIPIVIALLLFQKALIRGLASGAVKG